MLFTFEFHQPTGLPRLSNACVESHDGPEPPRRGPVHGQELAPVDEGRRLAQAQAAPWLFQGHRAPERGQDLEPVPPASLGPHGARGREHCEEADVKDSSLKKL